MQLRRKDKDGYPDSHGRRDYRYPDGDAGREDLPRGGKGWEEALRAYARAVRHGFRSWRGRGHVFHYLLPDQYRVPGVQHQALRDPDGLPPRHDRGGGTDGARPLWQRLSSGDSPEGPEPSVHCRRNRPCALTLRDQLRAGQAGKLRYGRHPVRLPFHGRSGTVKRNPGGLDEDARRQRLPDHRPGAGGLGRPCGLRSLLPERAGICYGQDRAGLRPAHHDQICAGSPWRDGL